MWDPTPLLIMDDTGAGTNASGDCCDLQLTVSFDGTNYLVTYRDTRNAGAYVGNATISAARVLNNRTRGTFVNGAQWLVWSNGPEYRLNASRVSMSGQVPTVWPDGFSLTTANATGATQPYPVIAAQTNSRAHRLAAADSEFAHSDARDAHLFCGTLMKVVTVPCQRPDAPLRMETSYAPKQLRITQLSSATYSLGVPAHFSRAVPLRTTPSILILGKRLQCACVLKQGRDRSKPVQLRSAKIG